ncbi:putative F-box domain-containing protein [Helianthus annuus]|nr:putative F-box domain-containing protein [Helianthus annuus]
MSSDLCGDLIADIFSRLPTKSLLRFRSVSKSLCACIGSPDFIQLHSLRSPNTVVVTHRIRDKGEAQDKHIYTLHSDGQLAYKYHPYTGIPTIEYPFKKCKIVGSCNGILCVCEYGTGEHGARLYLWNPSIRRKVTVPFISWVDGFGFDPIIDDYKILRISKAGSSVYTVKTRTCRVIASPISLFSSWKSYQCIFNGALHWTVKRYLTRDIRHYYIMTFDLSSEVFSTIELPEPSWKTRLVTVIKGSLAVISTKPDYSMIWVMREYNNIASWSVVSELNSNPFKGAQRVVPITPNDELLCISFKYYKEILVYNPKTQVRMRLADFSDSSMILDVNLCVESLGLLDMGLHEGRKLPGKQEENK